MLSRHFHSEPNKRASSVAPNPVANGLMCAQAGAKPAMQKAQVVIFMQLSVCF